MKKLILCSLLVTTTAFANSFDKPQKTVVTNLPADPLNPKAKRTVTCHTFPDAIVKVVDHGEKGAARLSLLPKDVTRCTEDVERTEHIITNWAGYFLGVKMNYAFFKGDDYSVRGGLPVLVYNLKEKRPLFSDEIEGGKFAKIDASGKGLHLRYTRVFSADCTVTQAMGQKCQQKILERTGIADTFMGNCLRAYDEIADKWARKKCELAKSKDPHCPKTELPKAEEMTFSSPTVVTYEAEARVPAGAPAWDPIDPKNYVKKISDAKKCYPAE